MNPAIVPIVILVLAIAVVVLALALVHLNQKLKELGEHAKQESFVEVRKPFSDPRPGPEPVPPMLAPAMPVVPLADPNIRPTRFAYEQNYFERCYAPCRGRVTAVKVKVNDLIEKGDPVMSLVLGEEESELRASASGKVREVNVKEGSVFKRDDLLYVIQ